MIALIYARVSTEEQLKRGYSVPEQLSECRKRAAELGATDTIEIIDDVGGDILERPKLEQARQMVRSGSIKWFICLDPDRFSRNLLNQLLVTNEIDQAGVDLVFIQHDRQKTAEGDLFYAVRGAIAEFEKKKIIERLKRGKTGKAKQGLLPGNLDAYGYTMDKERDILVVNEAEAPWVRKMFEWAANPDPDERMGQFKIARELSRLGVPAPRGLHWYRSTVKGILGNALYTGVLRWGRYDHSGTYQASRIKGKKVRKVARPPEQVIDLPVPAIISPDLFARVQHYIQLDKHRRSKAKTHMLTGIAYCARCGGHIQSKTMSKRYLVCANRYPVYDSMKPEKRDTIKPCDLPHVQTDPVEDFVWATVRGWLENPASLQTFSEEADQLPNTHGSTEEEIQLLQVQLTEAEQAQARVLSLVARAHVKPEIAERQINELAGQIQALTKRLSDLRSTPLRSSSAQQSWETFISEVEKISEEVRDRLDVLSEANRVNLIRRLVSRVVLGGKSREHWQVVKLRLS